MKKKTLNLKQKEIVQKEICKIALFTSIHETESYLQNLYISMPDEPIMHWLLRAVEQQQIDIMESLNGDSAIVVCSEVKAEEI